MKCQLGLDEQSEIMQFPLRRTQTSLESDQTCREVRTCRNEQGEILNDLVREDGIILDQAITKRQSRKWKLLCLFLEKSSKDHHQSECDETNFFPVWLFLSTAPNAERVPRHRVLRVPSALAPSSAKLPRFALHKRAQPPGLFSQGNGIHAKWIPLFASNSKLC